MVRTVEKYEVTLGQLASMPNLHNLLDESEQLHVGDWLVVSACAGFGYADNVVYTHARTHESEYEAVDFAEFSSTLELDHGIYDGGRYLYQYEVWHVVKDGTPMPERVSDHCMVNGEYCGDCQNYDADNDLCKFRRSLAQMRIAGDLDMPAVKRHYYALFAPYGVTAISDGDRAYRFDSKRDRDAWVEDSSVSFDGVPYRETTTLAYIRRHDVPVYDFEGCYFPESQVM